MSTAADTAAEKSSAQPQQYGSGTSSGAGFGNKSSADPSAAENDDTRFDRAHTRDPYVGDSKYGSGVTAGPGAGNKMTAVTSGDGGEDGEELKLGLSATDTNPYSGATGYGSGSTAGVGYGNKTGSHDDSTSGKLMEKVGGMFGNKKLEQKGRSKREAAKLEEGVEVDEDGDVQGVDGEADGDVRQQRREEAGWGKFATS